MCASGVVDSVRCGLHMAQDHFQSSERTEVNTLLSTRKAVFRRKPHTTRTVRARFRRHSHPSQLLASSNQRYPVSPGLTRSCPSESTSIYAKHPSHASSCSSVACSPCCTGGARRRQALITLAYSSAPWTGWARMACRPCCTGGARRGWAPISLVFSSALHGSAPWTGSNYARCLRIREGAKLIVSLRTKRE
jgi:hypothetical protein